MADKTDDWTRYWRSESPQGEVFVNTDGEKHPALDAFWKQELGAISRGHRLVDLATGAGSVLSALPERTDIAVFACDLSVTALARLIERFPDVETAACDAAATPYADGSMDWVVSQFGIEYAGRDAFFEAARLLAPGGRLAALCHYRDGMIDRSHQRQLAAAKSIAETNFVGKARELINAAFTSDRGRFDKAAERFIPVERTAADHASRQPTGVHAHLYGGFRTLYERRRQYDAKDITDWLDAMATEVATGITRLRAITSVALDAADIAAIGDGLANVGLVWQTPEPFFGSDKTLPVAWALRASRPHAD